MSIVETSTVAGLAPIQPTVFKLANGKKVTVASGDFLPAGLPADFNVVVIPHTFLQAVDADVFVQTNLLEMQEMIKMKKRDVGGTRHTLRSAKKEIHKALQAGLTPLFKAMSEGNPDAQQTWTDFCNDCVIVAACLSTLGREIHVTTRRPDITTTDEGITYISSPIFKICVM
jgi:hypothetical protein